MTVRADIRDRMIFELNAAPPTGVPSATKRRFTPGRKDNADRIAVFFLEEGVDQAAGRNSPIVKRSMIFAVQAIASVEDPDTADDAVEPMLAHITDIMGDTKLNGLTTGVFEVGTIWQTAESSLFHIVALTRWRIEYQTQRGDLTQKQ